MGKASQSGWCLNWALKGEQEFAREKREKGVAGGGMVCAVGTREQSRRFQGVGVG